MSHSVPFSLLVSVFSGNEIVVQNYRKVNGVYEVNRCIVNNIKCVTLQG